jgi:hypothetical protein
MKTKLHFSRCMMLMIALMSTIGGALAQTSQTLTQNVCPGTESYRVTPGNTSDTFLWSISTGTTGVNWTITTPTLSSTNVVWANPTAQVTYRLSLTETNGSSCTTVVSVDVTVYPLPTPVITGLATTPNLSSVVYTTQAGMTGYTWTVSAGGTITAGGTATDNTATVKWNAVGPQTVSVNYGNANSCTAAIPTVYNVTVYDLPVPTITGPTPVCVNTTNNVYVTEAGMTGYTWTVGAGGTITAGGTATDNTVTVTWNTAGPQTVTVNYTNGAGYTAATPASKVITVNSLPVPTITGSSLVCIGTAGSVYSTETGMTGYSWVVSAGGTITSGGTASDNTVTITWNTAGPQTVSVNYTNATGCMATNRTNKDITVNPLPTTSPIWHN